MTEPSDPPPFTYRLFGLSLESELAIPELSPCESAEEPDVKIVARTVAGPIVDGGPDLNGDVVRFSEVGVAHYSVVAGRRIEIEIAPGADPRNVRLFLLGSAMGMVLQQRGTLPIHANAVEIDGGAHLFMGGSGEGKSTLAAWFHDRGYHVLADDVCAVSVGGGGIALAHAGLPRVRLWGDAIHASGRAEVDYARSYAGDERWRKFDVPLERADDLGAAGLPVVALYELVAGEAFAVRRLPGATAFERIVANIYRGAMLPMTDPSSRYWRSCIALTESTPVFTVTRRWGFEPFDAEAEALVAYARTVAAQAT